LSSAHQSLSLPSLLDSDEEEESDELFVAMETFFFDISFSTTLDSFVTTVSVSSSEISSSRITKYRITNGFKINMRTMSILRLHLYLNPCLHLCFRLIGVAIHISIVIAIAIAISIVMNIRTTTTSNVNRRRIGT
jgi:hypothetical protein